MKSLCSNLIAFFLCVGLTGCAYFNTAFRTYDNRNNSVMVDVKQRAIISGWNGDLKQPVICAEPSPDAMSAYAAELAGSITTPQKIKGDFAAAFQEGSGFVGLRTQSIQLLRDSMYRLCESYMNGAIDHIKYDLLLRRYQKNMVALLAIEQLTGTVKVAPIIINTRGSASAAETIDDLLDAQQRLSKDRHTMNAEIAGLDKKIGEYQTQLDKAAEPEKTELKNKITAEANQKDQLNSRLKTVDNTLKQLDETIKNPRGVAVSGLTTSDIGSESPKLRSDKAITDVAKYVQLIVNQIIDEGDDLTEMCLRYFQGDKRRTQLDDLCNARFKVESQKLGVETQKLKMILEDQKKLLETK